MTKDQELLFMDVDWMHQFIIIILPCLLVAVHRVWWWHLNVPQKMNGEVWDRLILTCRLCAFVWLSKSLLDLQTLPHMGKFSWGLSAAGMFCLMWRCCLLKLQCATRSRSRAATPLLTSDLQVLRSSTKAKASRLLGKIILPAPGDLLFDMSCLNSTMPEWGWDVPAPDASCWALFE